MWQAFLLVPRYIEEPGEKVLRRERARFKSEPTSPPGLWSN